MEVPIKQWTQLLGTSSQDYVSSISNASDGSIYIAGHTEGSLDGQQNSGGSDAFISRYTSDGTRQWTRLLGTSSNDAATSIVAAADGTLYVAGGTQRSLDGNPNTLDGQTHYGSSDAFISKFTSDGTMQWIRLLGTSSSDYATGISTAADASIYIVGVTFGDLDGQTHRGRGDAFISRYTSDGTRQWTQLLGTSSQDYASSISTAADGSIYVTGWTTGDLDGQTKNGYGDAFISKYNSNGSKQWTRLLGTASINAEEATSISTAPDGSLYVTGITYGDLDGQTNNGYGDVFLSKYTSDGSREWTRLLGSSSLYSYDHANSVNITADGSIYIAGHTEGSLDGQQNSGGSDAFISRYTSDGTRQWTQLLGTSSQDYASSISTAADGSIYVTGGTTGDLEGKTNNGSGDAFITKFNSTKNYTLTPSAASINEGSTLTTSVATTDVASGTTLYYSLSGTGINTADFSSGALTGSGTVSSSGSFSFSHTLANDLSTEGTETLNIKLYSDSSRSTQVGSTASISIADTSKTPPTYTLTPSGSSINEGSTLTTSIATTDVASGTTLYYALSGTGINTADFSSGALTGSGTVGSNGSFSFSHTLANDLSTEGTETLNIKLYSDSSRSTQVGSTALASIADTSLGLVLTYYNSNTNKTLDTWNVYQVSNSVKAGDIVSQWFGTAAPAIQKTQDVIDTKLMDVAATWSDKVQINRVVKASDSGEFLAAKQIDYITGEIAGSVVSGGKGNDEIKGFAGWDNLEGGEGNDLIHGGNGRDIISGGAGRDELHGDFGWNTYRSEIDGVSDLIAIKSDHYLVNWLYGKAGNSPNGEKSDIIEGLDAIDKIRIIGVDTSEITFAANVITKGVTGIGIYGKGILEALYTGGDLTVAQITQMTSGDASAAAMSNSINAYGVW